MKPVTGLLDECVEWLDLQQIKNFQKPATQESVKAQPPFVIFF